MHSMGRLQTMLLLGASATTIGAQSVLASETDNNVDNIVVTGARTTNTIEEIPNTTTVIRLEEI